MRSRAGRTDISGCLSKVIKVFGLDRVCHVTKTCLLQHIGVMGAQTHNNYNFSMMFRRLQPSSGGFTRIMKRSFSVRSGHIVTWPRTQDSITNRRYDSYATARTRHRQSPGAQHLTQYCLGHSQDRMSKWRVTARHNRSDQRYTGCGRRVRKYFPSRWQDRSGWASRSRSHGDEVYTGSSALSPRPQLQQQKPTWSLYENHERLLS